MRRVRVHLLRLARILRKRNYSEAQVERHLIDLAPEFAANPSLTALDVADRFPEQPSSQRPLRDRPWVRAAALFLGLFMALVGLPLVAPGWESSRGLMVMLMLFLPITVFITQTMALPKTVLHALSRARHSSTA